ncbi:MAG TPA: POTRA domain-containing protein [Vicinamibacterales bacterium]|nr:POTRA domain-containing protein [Vicinamibacterales bacterium]
MTHAAIRLVALSALLALAALPARAQAPIDAYLGRLVADVRVTISGQLQTDSSLLALVTVRAGQPLTTAAVRSTMDQFGRLGRFDDVRFLVDEVPAGLVVTVALEPRHPIDRIVLTGTLGLPAGELEGRVRQLYGGLPPADANLRNVEQAIERALTDEGFLNARVLADTVPVPATSRSTLVLAVEAGSRATIRSVTVDNQSPLPDRDVRSRTAVEDGQPYRPRALATALAGLREQLSRQGYYSAVVGSQVFESSDRTGVDLEILVDAGPRIRVEWAGDRPIGNIDDLVPIRREGSADEDLLEDADQLIRRALVREGYRNATVQHSREERDGELVITFTVARGRRFRLARIELPAGLFLRNEEILRLMDLAPGDPVDDARVLQGLGRVAVAFQQEGFYQFSAVPAYEEVAGRSTGSDAWLVLHPEIVEGPRGLISQVVMQFDSAPPRVAESDLRALMRARPGEPYSFAAAVADRFALETFYRNRGFREAGIELRETTFGADGTAVTLVLYIVEGPETLVGDITVVGNRRVSEQTILERITMRVGEPFGPAAQEESRRRLAELGIARVNFSEQQRFGGDERVHVILSVEEAPATSFGFGGGLEVGTRSRSVAGEGVEDVLEAAPRGFVEIARRHIGGRDRTVSAFGRVGLRRETLSTEESGGFGFIEYRATVSYRGRRAFQSSSDLLVGFTSEQGVRTNFNFLRQAINAEVLRRVSPAVAVSGRYALDFTKLFDEIIPPDEQPTVDRLFPQVRLSMLSTGIAWDRRDSVVGPTRGQLVTADFETALTLLGSEVDYVKTFLQYLRLTPLTGSRRLVLATRAQLGIARAAEREPDDDSGPIDPDDSLDDLPASQRFFAGGSTTVRGFQLDRLGVEEILSSEGLSDGGNAVLILNAELRSGIADLFGRPLAAVLFVDGGNVFRRARDLDLDRLRGTAGFGFRWDSPLGPLRVDAGFKLTRNTIAGRRERGWELHLSIGEAF